MIEEEVEEAKEAEEQMDKAYQQHMQYQMTHQALHYISITRVLSLGMLRKKRKPHSTIPFHMPNHATYIANNWSTLPTNIMLVLLPRLFNRLLPLSQYRKLCWYYSIPPLLLPLLLGLLQALPLLLPFS